PHTNETSL
nr:Chain D, Colorectal mutant cancer protein [Homo sapiens]6MTV_E Chain E, Colorectal mutant cancer protein [Homo sapiens]